MKKTYCLMVRNLPKGNVHRDHHDSEHGFLPIDDDDLFRRLILEINQAGLSFDIVLKKKKELYSVYSDVIKVSKFNEKDISKLMNNAGIIRNRLKILAARFDANKIIELQKSHGSFGKWIEIHHPKSKDEWVKIFRKEFKFVGGEIVNEFLMSTGHLPGAHDIDCKVGIKIKKYKKNEK